jgi:hypothetical protein
MIDERELKLEFKDSISDLWWWTGVWWQSTGRTIDTPYKSNFYIIQLPPLATEQQQKQNEVN